MPRFAISANLLERAVAIGVRPLFLISKLVWIIGQPLSLAFLLMLICLAAMLRGSRVVAMTSCVLAILVLFVALYTTAGAYLMQGLEARFARPRADPDNLTCMIVLGGGFEAEVTTSRGGYEFNAAGDRFVEALRLAQKYPAARVVIAGGDGSLSGRYEGDAVIAERFFAAFGLGPDRLLKDGLSRTTFENAVNVKALLAEKGLSHCLLITSAFHMPRSMGIFGKLGMDVVPWPVDYRSPGDDGLTLDFSQPSQNVQLLSTAMREWIGMVGYYAAGRTSALYPG